MVKTQKEQQTQVNGMETSIAVILSKVEYIEQEVNEIKTRMQKDYVTQDQFKPVHDIVYGLVSLVLIAVVGAIIALVIKK